MDDSEYAGVVRAAMADLTKQFSHPAEIDVTLAGVTAASILLIAGVDSADVLLIGGPTSFWSLAQSSPLAVELDGAQQRFGEGPCVDAAIGDPMVCFNDLRADSRWPRFAAVAVAAGVHSMFSFQLYTHNHRMGALNLFDLKPDAFGADAQAVGVMLATHAAIALIAHDTELNFQSALASRDIIGQAKGMIMERFGVDAVRAFDLLTSLSQSSNTRVAEIAADIVARGPEHRLGSPTRPSPEKRPR